MATPDPDPTTVWPAVPRAYEFVIPSYQFLVNRFEAADNRLTHSITLASSVLFGIPILARAIRPDISLQSPWLIASLAFAVVAALLGIIGRQRGRLRLTSPATLYDTWLHKSDWLFKKDMVYFAGQSFGHNARAIETKGRITAIVNTCVAVALLLAAIATMR